MIFLQGTFTPSVHAHAGRTQINQLRAFGAGRGIAAPVIEALCLATCSTKVTTKMVKLNLIVYFVGVVAFAIVYEPVKQSLGGGLLFFILAIAYLISLRALGCLLINKLNQPEGMNKK